MYKEDFKISWFQVEIGKLFIFEAGPMGRALKGTVSRDIFILDFFYQTASSGPIRDVGFKIFKNFPGVLCIRNSLPVGLDTGESIAFKIIQT